MVVTNVFNALYNGEIRKTIIFGTENSFQETWIEGIGSSAGFLNPKWDFHPPFDVDYWLCSANDWSENLFYNSVQFEPCNCSNNLNLFCQDPFTFYFEQANTSCFGISDGSVVFYDVLDCLWPDGVWSNNRNDLTAGNYVVQVYDLMNNLSYVLIDIENPDLIHSNNDLITSESCNAPGDGSIEVNITDGTPPYSYDWIGENSNSNTLDNLSTGLYTLIASDSTGCRDTMEYFVPIKNMWVTSNIQRSCNTPENGSIEVNVINDESPPYSYQWIGENSTSNVLDSLSSGIYTLIVGNSIGCIDTMEYFVQNTEISVYANSSIDESLQDETIEGTEVSLYAITFSAAPPVTYEWLPSGIVNSPDSLHTSASIDVTTTFTLLVNDSDGCIGIDSVNVFIDNTNDVTSSREYFSINIYPIPTNGKFTIETGGSIVFSQIKITDNLGKEVQFHLEELNGSYELFLDQPKGVYFVHFWNQNNSFSRKILLE